MGDGTQPSGSPVPSEISRPLSFHIPEHVVSRYATNFVVQCTGQEFVLSFFEALPPFLLGDSPEENRAILEEAVESTRNALHALLCRLRECGSSLRWFSQLCCGMTRRRRSVTNEFTRVGDRIQ